MAALCAVSTGTGHSPYGPAHDIPGARRFPIGSILAQTILARVTSKPHAVRADRKRSAETDTPRRHDAKPPTRLHDLFSDQSGPATREDRNVGASEGDSRNGALQRIIAEGFQPDTIGRAILAQVNGRDDFVERGIALTATILTDYEAGLKKGRKT